MPAPDLARTAAGVRIVAGGLCVAAPDLAMRLCLLRPGQGADTTFLIRVFGSRAMALGALSAGLAGPKLAQEVRRASVAVDLLDVASTAWTHRAGRIPTRTFAYQATVAAASAIIGLRALEN